MKALRIWDFMTSPAIKSITSAVVTSFVIGLNIAVSGSVQAGDNCSLLHEKFETALYEYGDLDKAQLILDELFRRRCPGRQHANESYKAAWNQHMDELRRERDRQIAENERLRRELEARRYRPEPIGPPPRAIPPGRVPPQRPPSRPCQDSVGLLGVCVQEWDNESPSDYYGPDERQ